MAGWSSNILAKAAIEINAQQPECAASIEMTSAAGSAAIAGDHWVDDDAIARSEPDDPCLLYTSDAADESSRGWGWGGGGGGD